jgi:hypothetical protein
MRTALLGAAVLGGLLLAGGPAHAADPARERPAAASPETSLILSIRARALGVLTDAPDGATFERVKAPTGEGTSRMPSATTEVGRGVYVSVMPACIPGVDEPAFPQPYRRPLRRR